MTLIRFDEVYVVYFKTNKCFLSSYPNMTNYMRELYQHPIINASINMEHIKVHYFSSHPKLNDLRYVCMCGCIAGFYWAMVVASLLAVVYSFLFFNVTFQ